MPFENFCKQIVSALTPNPVDSLVQKIGYLVTVFTLFGMEVHVSSFKCGIMHKTIEIFSRNLVKNVKHDQVLCKE